MSDGAPLIKVRKDSLAWGEISAWAEYHLKSYRLQLENEHGAADKVAGLRARISLLKSLLNATPEDQTNVKS